ncbi:hypothetical protein [Avibacterium sp. 21-599]|uniref:hypothetical protein n=1 Tax=Avibacterium sp. 21-599 TaxID=2911528 RepID=UPI0022468656|nr:hypothetical protein [Avibacterium sp. 21-599]MCW9718560.1 hypothetical protein [Avibacterium sp. 21-599]
MNTLANTYNINITQSKNDSTGLELGTNSMARGSGAIATGKNSLATGKNAVATGGNETKESIDAKLTENRQKLTEIDNATKNVNTLLNQIQALRATHAKVIEAGERIKQVRLAKENARIDWQNQLTLYNNEVSNSTSFFREMNAKIDDLNSRLSAVSSLPNINISSDNDLTQAATAFKSTVEQGTSLNLSTDFYMP